MCECVKDVCVCVCISLPQTSVKDVEILEEDFRSLGTPKHVDLAASCAHACACSWCGHIPSGGHGAPHAASRVQNIHAIVAAELSFRGDVVPSKDVHTILNGGTAGQGAGAGSFPATLHCLPLVVSCGGANTTTHPWMCMSECCNGCIRAHPLTQGHTQKRIHSVGRK